MISVDSVFWPHQKHLSATTSCIHLKSKMLPKDVGIPASHLSCVGTDKKTDQMICIARARLRTGWFKTSETSECPLNFRLFIFKYNIEVTGIKLHKGK